MDIFQSQFIFSGCNFLSVLPSVLRTKSRHDNLNLRRCVCVWRHVVLLLHHRTVTYHFLRHLSFFFFLSLSLFSLSSTSLLPHVPFSFLSVIPPCFSFLRFSVLLLPLWLDSSSLVGVKKRRDCVTLIGATRVLQSTKHTHTHIWQRQLISQDVDTTQGQQNSSCGEQSSWLWVINPGRTRYLFTCLSGGSAWWSSELKKAKKASTNHLTVSETLHFWDSDSETPWMPLSRSLWFIARTPQPQHSCRETRSSCDKRHDFRPSDRLYLPSKLLHVIN